MARLKATPIRVSASARKRLKRLVRAGTTPYRDWVRAQIVLLAARCWPNARIARHLRISHDTVRLWRARFAEHGLAGLADRPRSGRPRSIPALARAEICALACRLPAQTGVPLARWSGPELRTEIINAGVVEDISAASIRRILAENPIKPWQYQSWIFPRDPDFAAKAAVICDLYQGFYRGQPLGPGDRIISVDAKPSIQARQRRHRRTPPAPGRPMRVEHEYIRHGALALLAALDIHNGQVTAATPKTTGIAPFMDLMDQIMSQQPYADADRVLVIVDNGSDHRGQAAINRLRQAHPNCIMIHTPVHASWLNQVEIFFSIVQKKVLSPNDFGNLENLRSTLQAFIDRYNTTAKPFNWKFTTTDLHNVLAHIENQTAEPPPNQDVESIAA